MSRKWTEERLLGVLAYRPFITVSHFDAADDGKRKCAVAAKRDGLVTLEQRTGYFVVRLARQPENAYTRRRYRLTVRGCEFPAAFYWQTALKRAR